MIKHESFGFRVGIQQVNFDVGEVSCADVEHLGGATHADRPQNAQADTPTFIQPICNTHKGVHIVIPGGNPGTSVSTIRVQLVIHNNRPASPC